MIRLPPLPLNVRWPLQIHRAMHRQEIRSTVQYEQDHSTNGMDCSFFGMAVLYPRITGRRVTAPGTSPPGLAPSARGLPAAIQTYQSPTLAEDCGNRSYNVFFGSPAYLDSMDDFFESRPCQTFYITGFLSVAARMTSTPSSPG